MLPSSQLLPGQGAIIAANVRRLMAKEGLAFGELALQCDLDERTLRGLMRGQSKPHTRTLTKIADGLAVPIDELFCNTAVLTLRLFDRSTNSLVQKIATHQPQLFENWVNSDFDELFSRFGEGGSLTESGIISAAKRMNEKKTIHNQVSLILESNESELLEQFVEMLYKRSFIS